MIQIQTYNTRQQAPEVRNEVLSFSSSFHTQPRAELGMVLGPESPFHWAKYLTSVTQGPGWGRQLQGPQEQAPWSEGGRKIEIIQYNHQGQGP